MCEWTLARAAWPNPSQPERTLAHPPALYARPGRDCDDGEPRAAREPTATFRSLTMMAAAVPALPYRSSRRGAASATLRRQHPTQHSTSGTAALELTDLLDRVNSLKSDPNFLRVRSFCHTSCASAQAWARFPLPEHASLSFSLSPASRSNWVVASISTVSEGYDEPWRNFADIECCSPSPPTFPPPLSLSLSAYKTPLFMPP